MSYFQSVVVWRILEYCQTKMVITAATLAATDCFRNQYIHTCGIDHTIRYQGPILWNAIIGVLGNSGSIKIFKVHCKHILLSDYN